MNALQIAIKNTSDLPLPAYQTAGAACFDLLAAIDTTLTLAPGERSAVPTGISVALPQGYEMQIRGRSGLAARHGISLVNGIGTIDADYRGEIHVILINHGDTPFVIERGDRIAQAAVSPVQRIVWSEVAELDQTERGAGGLGSTGKA